MSLGLVKPQYTKSNAPGRIHSLGNTPRALQYLKLLLNFLARLSLAPRTVILDATNRFVATNLYLVLAVCL